MRSTGRTLPAKPLREFLWKKQPCYTREDMSDITGVGIKKLNRLMRGEDCFVAFHTADMLITRLHGVPCVVYGDQWYEAVPVSA